MVSLYCYGFAVVLLWLWLVVIDFCVGFAMVSLLLVMVLLRFCSNLLFVVMNFLLLVLIHLFSLLRVCFSLFLAHIYISIYMLEYHCFSYVAMVESLLHHVLVYFKKRASLIRLSF